MKLEPFFLFFIKGSSSCCQHRSNSNGGKAIYLNRYHPLVNTIDTNFSPSIGWISIRGLFDYWNVESFESIARLCGGLEEIDEQTSNMTHLSEAILRVTSRGASSIPQIASSIPQIISFNVDGLWIPLPITPLFSTEVRNPNTKQHFPFKKEIKIRPEWQKQKKQAGHNNQYLGYQQNTTSRGGTNQRYRRNLPRLAIESPKELNGLPHQQRLILIASSTTQPFPIAQIIKGRRHMGTQQIRIGAPFGRRPARKRALQRRHSPLKIPLVATWPLDCSRKRYQPSRL